jgi:C-terminal processing protease CtpA/Prc
MKKFRLFVLLISCLVILQGCDPGTSATDSDEITASEEKQFVWNGLNFWYFWQAEVADLADEMKENKRSFSQFLNGFNSERALFDHLIVPQDEFSWFIDDYREHERAQVGTTKSFGFRYGLAFEVGSTGANSDKIFGYVQYVVEDSPADRAGLKRGDIFRGINGQDLTFSNYINLLRNEQYDLQMATVRLEGDAYRIENRDETVKVVSETLTENPIHTVYVHDTGSKKVGYLLYNSFRLNFHKELNDIFGEFRDQGVEELILDLRYNGGGTLLTSALLASMISGVSEESIFAKLKYNSKRASNSPRPFTFHEKVPIYDNSREFIDDDTILNSLGLRRVYVLTSSRTASASETVINGLIPYGVEVVKIGTKTVGKDDGSITVYDAPRASYSPGPNQRSMINSNHPRAMQPIVFKIVNANDQDYPDGFFPDITQSEYDHLEGGLPPLGDPEEHLFKAALAHIEGSLLAKEISVREVDDTMYLMDSIELTPFHFDQYLIPSDLDRY